MGQIENQLAVRETTTGRSTTATAAASNEEDFEYIMVATGYMDTSSSSKSRTNCVEVLQLGKTSGSAKTCSVSSYPLLVDDAVALANNGNVVVCGGYTGSSTKSNCYRYSNNRWSREPFSVSMNGAMSVEIRPGEWLLLGGWPGSQPVADTYILKHGRLIKGPSLPEPIHGGSVVMMNDTHLFVASGDRTNKVKSVKNYLLDVHLEKWSRIADRSLPASRNHVSGTFYNSTVDEIQIANVGFYGIEVYSPSNDSWHSGIPTPVSRLTSSAVVQLNRESFLLIGGRTNNTPNSDEIFMFNNEGLTVRNLNALHIRRDGHIAMPISKDDFECNCH